MPDITDTLAPKSDQLDAVDLLSGPRTFTITDVRVTGGDQPVSMKLAEFPRVYRPNKSMRRVIVACWGPDTDTYIGRRLTLFCEPKVEWAGKEVGGIRVSHLSHIAEAKKVPLLIKKTQSEMYRVDPLADAPAAPAENPAAKAVAHFATLGIQRPNLEAHIGRPVTEWTPEDLADLRALGGQIARGEKTAEDVFGGGS